MYTRSVEDTDPDPYGSALILIGWIRIRIQIRDVDPNPGGQKLPSKKKSRSRYALTNIRIETNADQVI
jgi:hypothetical protein